MDLTRIKYFAVVAETGSLRRASELLHVSPAALSRAIAHLEAELDVELFIRSGRGIAITDAGRQLERRAQRLLSEYDAFVKGARGVTPRADTLRIGTFEIFSTHFLGWILEQHFSDRPVLVREVIPAEMEKALVDRDVDLAITYIPVPHEGLDFVKVASQPMAVYSRAGAFSKTPFEQIPFCIPLTPVSGTVLNVQGLDGWPLTGPTRNIRYQFQMLETALNVASRGLGAVFCPAFVIKLFNDRIKKEFRLEAVPYPSGMKPVKMDIYLVKRRSSHEDAEFRSVAKAIRMLCRS